MNNDYYDRTLLRLRREYGKDETVAALSKKLSETELENGKLQAEILHLQNLINQLQNMPEIEKLAKIEAKRAIKREEMYKILHNKCNSQAAEIRRLKIDINRLIAKCNNIT